MALPKNGFPPPGSFGLRPGLVFPHRRFLKDLYWRFQIFLFLYFSPFHLGHFVCNSSGIRLKNWCVHIFHFLSLYHHGHLVCNSTGIRLKKIDVAKSISGDLSVSVQNIFDKPSPPVVRFVFKVFWKCRGKYKLPVTFLVLLLVLIFLVTDIPGPHAILAVLEK